MPQTKWIVKIAWSRQEYEERSFSSLAELKDFLSREAFCDKHGCPTPEILLIERKS